ncbi:XRE family transcriptional regulator [Amycolatopsis sp. cg5]|uniref:XRE family transcriptional regulator n=1 Tax=Amycolatopsis sp. cg5 TaxID=3238802 RepID=UPI00352649DF
MKEASLVGLPREPRFVLARRLKELRERRWPARAITQKQLAEALSMRRPVGETSISSWESSASPKLPPVHRLEAYATFFATERSVEGEVCRLLDLGRLTEAERVARDDLLAELGGLRDRALSDPDELAVSGRRLLRFDDGVPVTIVCAPLPSRFLQKSPYADPDEPDYVRLYTYADADSLMELYAHVRVLNPGVEVRHRLQPEVDAADYRKTHLISLGGVDWNEFTGFLMAKLKLPISQESRINDLHGAHFKVAELGDDKTFSAQLKERKRDSDSSVGKKKVPPLLVEDVAHFYHGPNPLNDDLTVTICNGMYGRGTLGVVRALTDAVLGPRNDAYIEQRFVDREEISILTRVAVVDGQAIAPDWNDPHTRLHEWSEEPL